MKKLSGGFAALAVAAVVSFTAATAPAVSTINFNNDPAGEEVPFTNKDNGVSATFSSPLGADAFVVTELLFPVPGYFDGNFLGESSSESYAPLSVTLSTVETSANLAFATLDGSNSITLTAFNNGFPVGTATAISNLDEGAGTYLGLLSYTGAAYTSFILTSSDSHFDIDNLSVAVPEPSTWAAMLGGLVLQL